ncbi:Crp/Fnr family transcriptional regulator [Streptomyces sp. NPDC003090]|uniref:Crp/Fnr family transcriptional regulator n=1 Tax=Streptomyces sp. NPDC003090 TaxID=3154274 RepID=UPI00380348AF
MPGDSPPGPPLAALLCVAVPGTWRKESGRMRPWGAAATRRTNDRSGSGAWRALAPALLAELRHLGSARAYAPGDVLIEQGDRSSDLFFIESGTVKVTIQREADTPRLLEIRRGVDVVGEVAALDGRPRSATVTAGDEVSAVVIPREAVRGHFTVHPDTLFALAAGIVRRDYHRRLDLVGRSAKERLARALVELAMPHGRRGRGGLTLPIELTQDELASLICSKIRTVELALKELRVRGLVSTGRCRTTVLDLARLMEVARMSMPIREHRDR